MPTLVGRTSHCDCAHCVLTLMLHVGVIQHWQCLVGALPSPALPLVSWQHSTAMVYGVSRLVASHMECMVTHRDVLMQCQQCCARHCIHRCSSKQGTAVALVGTVFMALLRLQRPLAVALRGGQRRTCNGVNTRATGCLDSVVMCDVHNVTV